MIATTLERRTTEIFHLHRALSVNRVHRPQMSDFLLYVISTRTKLYVTNGIKPQEEQTNKNK